MSTFSVNANGTQVDALEGGTAGNIYRGSVLSVVSGIDGLTTIITFFN